MPHLQRKKSTKKPTAKQLAARAKFSRIMKSGGFKKRKSARRTTVTTVKTIVKKANKPQRRKNRPKSVGRRDRGGSASDINKSLLLDDIGRMKISVRNKSKIIRSIAKRLKI